MTVPFTLYEAIAAYLFDCWGDMHHAASEVPVEGANGKTLGLFVEETSKACRSRDLRWLSSSYEKVLQSFSMKEVHRMCERVMVDLADGDFGDVTALQDEIEEFLCGVDA